MRTYESKSGYNAAEMISLWFRRTIVRCNTVVVLVSNSENQHFHFLNKKN